MRLIPVLDLKDNFAVHAVKGERQDYLPVKSLLNATAEPVAVARAFRDRLGLSELYVADLNAIQGRGNHREVIARLALEERMTVYLDAGIEEPSDVTAALENGASKIIIGAETLKSSQALRFISDTIPQDRLIFSLDLVGGRVLSRSAELSSLAPLEVLERLAAQGWKEVILLDLARVGSGCGLDQDLIATIRRRFPEVSLLVGGGVRDTGDLRRLETLGVDGVLLATALHRGLIGPQDIHPAGPASESSWPK